MQWHIKATFKRLDGKMKTGLREAPMVHVINFSFEHYALARFAEAHFYGPLGSNRTPIEWNIRSMN